MPTSPHEYVVRKNADSQADFDAFIRFIRENGEVKAWRRKLFIYWFHDGRAYWTMGWPVVETIIINRCLLKDHDAVPIHPAHIKDGRWSSKDGMRPPL